MSYGKMNRIGYLQRNRQISDDQGFGQTVTETVASFRVYQEGRHGSERWSNLAAFSEATDLFRFRCVPGLKITTDMFLVVDGIRYDIESVEDVKSRGMYAEILAKRSVSSIG